MKLNASFLLMALLMGFSAQAKILGWIPQTLSESDAEKIVIKNVEAYVQDVSSCYLEDIGFFEAVHQLKNIKGEPVLVILSEAELSGDRCQAEKYVDCRTVFHKNQNNWEHEITFCEKPDQNRD